MVTHLESEVKWVLETITTNKASGGDGIPAELFYILKDDAVKVLHSVRQQIWKTQQWAHDWKKVSFHSNPKKGNAKECSKYHTILLILHANTVMLKILQARLQQWWTENFQMYMLCLEKAEEPEIKLPRSFGWQRKQGNSRKTSTSDSLTMLKPLTVWITTNWKILSEMEIPNHLTLETCMWVKKQWLEPYMEQMTGSKLGKGYD